MHLAFVLINPATKIEKREPFYKLFLEKVPKTADFYTMLCLCGWERSGVGRSNDKLVQMLKTLPV